MSGQSISDHMYFWVRRLYAPVGMIFSLSFLVLYMMPMSAAISGAQPFDGFMGFVNSLPIYTLFEVLFIAVPLVMHIALTIISLYTSSFNVINYGFYGNWMYLVRILASIYIIPFAVYFFVITNFSSSFVHGYADYAFIQNLLSTMGMKIFYVIGVASISLYFTMSVSAFLFEWGITSSKISRSYVSILMWLVGIIIAIWSERIILSFF